jgi:2-oxoglutarate ferredoxin oxidoreductase subunit gamma
MESAVRREIILSGAGGQGLILAGAILAEAAGVYENREVVQTQSYGIQARGGASQSTVIISDDRIKFPEVLAPDILLCLSPEAYVRYTPALREGGLLIVDQDLVSVEALGDGATLAEKMGHRIAANVIALGALAMVTGVVNPESIGKAIPSRLPDRNVNTALEALEIGVALAATVEARAR